MKLHLAAAYADKLVDWLSPYCHRIEIAGSIRRARPEVNDVDLVAIPKTESRQEKVDLIATEQWEANLLREHLVQYVYTHPESFWKGRDNHRGVAPRETAQNLLLILGKQDIQLDLWLATPDTWATRLVCRTGSKDHNIHLATVAKDLGFHWNPYEGITDNTGKLIRTETEQDFFSALALDWLPPIQRER